MICGSLHQREYDFIYVSSREQERIIFNGDLAKVSALPARI
jgi:hypothetical protein